MKDAEDSYETAEPLRQAPPRHEKAQEATKLTLAEAGVELARIVGGGTLAVAIAALTATDPANGAAASYLGLELYNKLVPHFSQRRINNLFLSLDERITLMEQDGYDLDLAARLRDPAFLSLLAEVCLIAIRNHSEVKLEALRNAVLNVAAEKTNVEEDVRFAFLALIDRFTASHLEVLSFSAYPRGWMELKLIEIPNPLPQDWSAKKTCLLEIQKNPLFFEMIIDELKAARLIEANPLTALDTSKSQVRLSSNFTTDLGQQFYLFFNDPLRAATEKQQAKTT